MEKFDVIITRHPALLKWAKKFYGKEVLDGARVIQHATPEDVIGKHTFGVLPLFLASMAHSHTELHLRIPQRLRGKELTEDQIECYREGAPKTYKVTRSGLFRPSQGAEK